MANPVRTPVSTTSSIAASPDILPLHPTQKPSSMANNRAPAAASMAHHREVLQRKLSEQKDSKFASPTDDLLSPCSQRLKDYKAKKATRLNQTLFKNTKAGVPIGKNLFAKRSDEKLPNDVPNSLATKDNEHDERADQKDPEDDMKMGGYDM